MNRILIVEDDKNISGLICDILEGVKYEVEQAFDGLSALEKLKKNKYDLVLLDIMIPKLSGYQVATQIHGLPNSPKIIIVTSRDFDEDKDVVKNVGAKAFLSKPFSQDEILGVVHDVLKDRE